MESFEETDEILNGFIKLHLHLGVKDDDSIDCEEIVEHRPTRYRAIDYI
jgi:hypothetical protein